MTDGAPEINPGVLLAQRMVEEMVLLREALTQQRLAIIASGEAADALVGYFEVLDRTVELMVDADQRPNWDLFLRSWSEASDEIFDEGEDEGGGDNPPDPAPRPPPGGFRRRPIVQ